MTDVANIHAALTRMGVSNFLAALRLKHRKTGSRVRFACPIHNGKDMNASAGIEDGRIVYVCFSGCGGAGGDALTLVAAVRGLDLQSSFRSVLEAAGSLAGATIGPAPLPPIPTPVATSDSRVLEALLGLCPLTGDGLDYLTRVRGLRADVCRAARVGFVADPVSVHRSLQRSFSNAQLDEMGIVYRGSQFAFARHRLLFPVVMDGKTVYVQGRALGEVERKQDRWRSMRGSVPAVFNGDSLLEDKPALIAEGPIDTLSAIQLFGEKYACVGLIGAGGFKDEWLRPFRGRDVLLALDPDNAGERGAAKTRAALLSVGARVRQLRLREYGCSDLNQWMVAESAA